MLESEHFRIVSFICNDVIDWTDMAVHAANPLCQEAATEYHHDFYL